MVYLLRDNHLFDRIAVQNATCKNWQIATQVQRHIYSSVCKQGNEPWDNLLGSKFRALHTALLNLNTNFFPGFYKLARQLTTGGSKASQAQIYLNFYYIIRSLFQVYFRL